MHLQAVQAALHIIPLGAPAKSYDECTPPGVLDYAPASLATSMLPIYRHLLSASTAQGLANVRDGGAAATTLPLRIMVYRWVWACSHACTYPHACA